ncbi:NAD(P)H-dependent oxidoreductase [Streptacidiphilus sp. ASG 303]|uniref:NAD(P)H-dependent oxidoreductase n=1 Tax=Streptacidiphilus sp. ASG 303 TaxID=2896847 RepID=UPI001E2FFAD1|nr:NAD(P)H-dependent oxidoreductase [Streptacidiphilus sp. ASG 303]MCD0485507.1 NAD(P)H-dependent oxidoreductase [Streptacidiphilus sp. ASG 303]
MTSLLVLSGSRPAAVPTALVAEHIAVRLSLTGFDVEHLDLRRLPPDQLLGAEGPALEEATARVAAARGLIIASAVHASSYTGLLKAFLDVLPLGALAGKTVLPLATGAGPEDSLALDYALRPVLAALGARHVVAGCFLPDGAVGPAGAEGAALLEPGAELRLFQAVDEFIQSLPVSPLAAWAE